MTTGVFIIARLSSTRLPAKNMMPILGKPMIQHLVERIAKSKTIDKIVITTSTLPSDDPLEALAEDIGIDCFRGDLDNVMERIVGAANYFNCDTVVEILGDNPLVHSSLIDDVVGLYHSKNLNMQQLLPKNIFLKERACHYSLWVCGFKYTPLEPLSSTLIILITLIVSAILVPLFLITPIFLMWHFLRQKTIGHL